MLAVHLVLSWSVPVGLLDSRDKSTRGIGFGSLRQRCAPSIHAAGPAVTAILSRVELSRARAGALP